MILIASPKKPFVLNSKGSAKRDAMLAAYDDEITNLFSASRDILPTASPGTWDKATTVAFVRRSVESVMGVEAIPIDDDIFSIGCDR